MDTREDFDYWIMTFDDDRPQLDILARDDLLVSPGDLPVGTTGRVYVKRKGETSVHLSFRVTEDVEVDGDATRVKFELSDFLT